MIKVCVSGEVYFVDSMDFAWDIYKDHAVYKAFLMHRLDLKEIHIFPPITDGVIEAVYELMTKETLDD